MFLTEYKKADGHIIYLPEGFKLEIEETSNGVYKIALFDSQMRSISSHGTDLDNLIEKAIEHLSKMIR